MKISVSLMCPLPNSWDSLIVATSSNATILSFNEIVASLLSKEMRHKNMEVGMQMPYL